MYSLGFRTNRIQTRLIKNHLCRLFVGKELRGSWFMCKRHTQQKP